MPLRIHARGLLALAALIVAALRISAGIRGQETECRHLHHRHGGAGAGSRRRQDHGRSHRQGLPGPALRRSQAQLPAQAEKRGPADLRRAATGDRLAAAADHPVRQSAHPGGSARLSRRLAVRRDPRPPHRAGHARHGRRPSPGQPALLARSQQRPPRRPRHRPEAGRDGHGRQPVFPAALPGFRPPPHRRREELGRADGALQRTQSRRPITPRGRISRNISACRWSVTSSRGPASRPPRRTRSRSSN